MGTGMGTNIYLLPSGDEDGTKVWYPLGLGMDMGMDFFDRNEYEIAKLVSVPSCYHP